MGGLDEGTYYGVTITSALTRRHLDRIVNACVLSTLDNDSSVFIALWKILLLIESHVLRRQPGRSETASPNVRISRRSCRRMQPASMTMPDLPPSCVIHH